MTFSIIGRDATGIGMAVTSSSPCVAARCLHVRAGVGAVASQNITDPRIGDRLLDHLAAGATSTEALTFLRGDDATMPYRQVTLLGITGSPAAHSGERTLGVWGESLGEDCVAAGNLLAVPDVVDAVRAGFETADGDLETRLLAALQAGLAAGGEAGPIHSAGLAVARDAGWNETDLRVDASEHPLEDLAHLLDLWLPQRADYVTRGLDPSTSPAYGVPGDE